MPIGECFHSFSQTFMSVSIKQNSIETGRRYSFSFRKQPKENIKMNNGTMATFLCFYPVLEIRFLSNLCVYFIIIISHGASRRIRPSSFCNIKFFTGQGR